MPNEEAACLIIKKMLFDINVVGILKIVEKYMDNLKSTVGMFK